MSAINVHDVKITPLRNLPVFTQNSSIILKFVNFISDPIYICDNWAMKVKTILNEYGFGSAWLNQSVEDQNKFIMLFERRIKDNFIQHFLLT